MVIYTSKTNLLQIESALESDCNTLQYWLTANKLLLNKTKSHTMILPAKLINPNLQLIHVLLPDLMVRHCREVKTPNTSPNGLTLNFHLNVILIILWRQWPSVLMFFTDPEAGLCSNSSYQYWIMLMLDNALYQTASKSNLVPLSIVCKRLCRFVLGCPFITHHRCHLPS